MCVFDHEHEKYYQRRDVSNNHALNQNRRRINEIGPFHVIIVVANKREILRLPSQILKPDFIPCFIVRI